MDVLPLARDDTGFDQVDHAIRTHFAVDAERLTVVQGGEHGVGKTTDTGLQDGAIGDQGCYVCRDAFVQGRWLLDGQFKEWPVLLHSRRNLADVKEAIAQASGHPLVDFRNDMTGAMRGRQAAIDAGSEAEESMLVRGAGLDKRNIEGQLAVSKEIFDFAQEDGGVIGAAFMDRLACVGAEKQAVVPEATGVFRTGVSTVPERQHVADFDVAEFGGPADQRIHQNLGSSASFPKPDTVAGLDDRYRIVNRHYFWAKVVPAEHETTPLASGCPYTTASVL